MCDNETFLYNVDKNKDSYKSGLQDPYHACADVFFCSNHFIQLILLLFIYFNKLKIQVCVSELMKVVSGGPAVIIMLSFL